MSKRKRSNQPPPEFYNYNQIDLKTKDDRLSGSILVGHLVNCDKPVHNVEVFFMCDHNNVQYVQDIEDVFALMKKQVQQTMYYPTKIPLWDMNTNKPSGTHSIVFVCIKNRKNNLNEYYLFDPNGYYDNNSAYIYKRKGVTFPTTTKYIDYIKKNKKITLRHLKVSGPQYFDKSPSGTGNIDDGGYCMFYNKQFISNFNNNNNNLDKFFNDTNKVAIKNLRSLYKRFFNVDDMGPYSIDVIKHIGNTCGKNLVYDEHYKTCKECPSCTNMMQSKKRKNSFSFYSRKSRRRRSVKKSRRRKSVKKSRRRKSVKKSRRRKSVKKSRRRRSVKKSRRRRSVKKSRRRRSVKKSRRRRSVKKSRRNRSSVKKYHMRT